MSKMTQVGKFDPEQHPLFLRLYREAGFKRLTEEAIDEMLSEKGLKLVVFAEDPNRVRETLDIVVIAPEVAKTFSANLSSCWMGDVKKARAMAARFGVRKLPAIALFRNEVYLGAAEGLLPWDAYIETLVEVAKREQAPKRTIAIMAAPSK